MNISEIEQNIDLLSELYALSTKCLAELGTGAMYEYEYE